MNLKQELKRFVRRGNFTLTGGNRSDLYFDLKESYGNPEILNALADELYKIIDKNATCVACIDVGGAPLASVLSSKYGLKLTIARDKLKAHGTQKMIEGYLPGLGDKVVIVDDVFTAGTSMRKALDALDSTKAEILGGYVIVKRGDGVISVPLYYLFSSEEFVE